MAVFPITYIMEGDRDRDYAQKWLWFKIARFARLPAFLGLLDETKFDALLDGILDIQDQRSVQETSREQKMNIKFITRYVYRIVSLIVIAVLLTYFLGCIWWLFVSPQLGLNDSTNNFIIANDLADLSL